MVSRPGLTDGGTGGSQIAAEMGFGGFRIFADLAPIFVGRIELIDRNLGIRIKLAPLTNESADRRGEVAHLRDCFVGGGEPGEVVLIVNSKPLQAIERPIEDTRTYLKIA